VLAKAYQTTGDVRTGGSGRAAVHRAQRYGGAYDDLAFL